VTAREPFAAVFRHSRDTPPRTVYSPADGASRALFDRAGTSITHELVSSCLGGGSSLI
jgi:hypothetical protein